MPVDNTESVAPSAAELLLCLRRPGDVQVAPNGARIAFTVGASYSLPGRPADSRVWIAEDGAARALETGAGRDRLPRWSPDGSRLAYAAGNGAARGTSVRLLESDAPIAELAGAVEDLAWSGDDELVALVLDPGDDEGGDPLVLRGPGHLRRLHRISLTTGESTVVGVEGLTVWEVDVGAHGSAAAIVSADPSESGWYAPRLVLADLRTGEVRRLHTPEWQIGSPRVSPDGAHVAFVEGVCSDRGILAGTVKVLELDSGAIRALAPELDLSDVNWIDASTLVCAGWRGLGSICGELALDGSWRNVWSGDATLGSGGGPTVSTSADGALLAAVKQTLEEPAEVMTLDARGADPDWQPLTRLNVDVVTGVELPTWRRLTWTAPDGLELEGLVARPRAAPDGPLPLVVLVHGGPTALWSYQFSHPFSLPILLASAGYALLLPNPRGSAGRGQEFARANIGDLGGAELEDILAGVDACVAEGIADAERIGIAGGSHGGYMAAWAVTQTDRFSASVPWACVSNFLSAHYGSDIAGLDDVFMGPRPHESADLYVERSPVLQARHCATPTLIAHGEEDPYCPVGQAHELYRALLAAGVEVELVLYPREGHGWSEREHVLDFCRRVRAWFDRHLLG